MLRNFVSKEFVLVFYVSMHFLFLMSLRIGRPKIGSKVIRPKTGQLPKKPAKNWPNLSSDLNW